MMRLDITIAQNSLARLGLPICTDFKYGTMHNSQSAPNLCAN